MIHTEEGRLTELTAVVAKDLEYVLEALGRGPSGLRSRDKTLLADSPRLARFEQRARDLQDIHRVLLALRHGSL